MNTVTKTIAAAIFALGATTVGASADYCSGRDHGAATAGGAIGGGLIGGLASHGNPLAIVGGAVGGALIGNAVARDQDCKNYYRGRGYYDGHRYYRHRKWQRDHYRYWN